MRTTIFQLINLIIVLVLLGVPVIVTVLLLKYFKEKADKGNSMEFLVNKIIELEKRIEVLEEELVYSNTDQ